MDLRIFTEPQQGAAYEDLLRVARCAEEAGFDAFFRSDHYLAMGDANGLPGPTDAWLTLAALARETSTIRLGTLMTAATFRLPGPLGITVAQVDQMSGGRVELGLGTGWYEAEHRAYGIPFPPLRERFGMLAEQLEILTGSWRTPGRASRTPTTASTTRSTTAPACPSRCRPRTRRSSSGATGRRGRRSSRRTSPPSSTCRSPASSALVDGQERVDTVCRERGRDPATLGRSTAQVLCVGRDEAEVARRADAIGRRPDELRANGIAGTPGEVVDKIGTFGERAGMQRVYLQVLDLSDLDHLELVASEVASQLAAA